MIIKFEKVDISDVVSISKEVIYNNLLNANGEFIKIYLYLISKANENTSYTKIADELNMLEGDVMRAVTYFVNDGIIKVIDEDIKDEISHNKSNYGITNYGLANEEKKDKATVEIIENKQVSKEFAVPNSNAFALDKISNDETFQEMLYIIQTYLSKTFTYSDTQKIAYIYDELGFSEELIEFLVEDCIQRNKKSLSYIEQVAINWHQNGVDTVEKAKNYVSSYNTNVWTVLKALGIKREPISKELDYIKKWFDEYGFSSEIIKMACERTILSISEPNFNYIDSILTKWYQNNAFTTSKIMELDAEHKNKQNQEYENKKNTKKKNKFNEFEQRDDDIDKYVLDDVQKIIK